jgi:Universal stress protein family.
VMASAPVRPVVVDIDPTAPSGDAVRWAAREAARRGADLHIVLPDDHRRSSACRAAFARALAAGRAAAPDVVVSAMPTAESSLMAASADAGVLVVTGPAIRADELVMTAYCPVVVVPDRSERPPTAPPGTPRHPHDDAPVVLAVGPGTGPETFAFAFAEASTRGAGLLAVRTWSDPLVDLGRLLPGHVARWDRVDGEVRHDVAEQLSAFTVAYPEVALQTLVVNDSCAEMLAALGHRARLMVLGRSARGAALNRLAISPALALARHVPCPVVVVPPPDLAHRSLLPTRPVGLADLHS